MSTGEPSGHSEEIIGRWFAQGDRRRDEVVLATKVYGGMGKPGPNKERGVSDYKSACMWLNPCAACRPTALTSTRSTTSTASIERRRVLGCVGAAPAQRRHPLRRYQQLPPVAALPSPGLCLAARRHRSSSLSRACTIFSAATRARSSARGQGVRHRRHSLYAPRRRSAHGQGPVGRRLTHRAGRRRVRHPRWRQRDIPRLQRPLQRAGRNRIRRRHRLDSPPNCCDFRHRRRPHRRPPSTASTALPACTSTRPP